MTRDDFIKKAIRAAEKALNAPAGWWGTYQEMHGPNGELVKFGQRKGVPCWVVKICNAEVTAEIGVSDSRQGAFRKAKNWKGR